MSRHLGIAVAAFAIALTTSAVMGCATAGKTGTAGGRSVAEAEGTSGPSDLSRRPAHADPDARYYEERAIAIGREAFEEIEPTDCARFRRGRLYAGGSPRALERALGEELSAAFQGGNSPAVIDVTSRILAYDQTDIRAHMLRGIALREMGRVEEADFHRAVATALIDSIMKGGDGRSPKTAWTVYQVKEEYEVNQGAGGGGGDAVARASGRSDV